MDSTLDRRSFFDLLGKGAAALALSNAAGCAGADGGEGASAETRVESNDEALFFEPPKHIAMLLYPELTLLDLIGPQSVFAGMGMNVHLVWKTRQPITSDNGVKVLPSMTFAECPQDVEVLFVPGSSKSTGAMIRDPEVVRFVRSRGERARWVTSVCTGSLILGAAGLLRGYKATSHWATRDLLPALGAERVDARYVRDRNRITGGGVTSGIDFGLHIMAQLNGAFPAQVAQLMLEYAPEPPFNSGEPSTAPKEVTGAVLAMWAPLLADLRLAVEMARLGL